TATVGVAASSDDHAAVDGAVREAIKARLWAYTLDGGGADPETDWVLPANRLLYYARASSPDVALQVFEPRLAHDIDGPIVGASAWRARPDPIMAAAEELGIALHVEQPDEDVLTRLPIVCPIAHASIGHQIEQLTEVTVGGSVLPNPHA